MLLQSGSQIVQHLQPGSYRLTVSARSGAGAYRLTTQFVQASPPGDPLAVDYQPDAVAVADLNGDGIPDIITANGDSYGQGGSYDRGDGHDHGPTVSVLLGNGDGTFQKQQTYTLDEGFNANAVAVADLNGDGIPDIITANNNGTVSVLLGNGDGTFQQPAALSATYGGTPDAVAVADLTGDGIPDIITANDNGNTVSVLLGNGDGTFQNPDRFRVGSEADAVAVADLTGDGIPDIVTANKDDNTVSVLLGNGDGTFQPQQTFAVGAGADAVAVADLTGDGIPDIVTANGGSYNNPGDTVSVLLGNGDGTFQPQRTFAVGSDPTAVAVADLTGDGNPDIITANRDSNTVSVLLGNGDGTFQPPQAFRGRLWTHGGGRGRPQRRRHPRHHHRQLWQQHGERAAGQRRRHLPDGSRPSPSAPIPTRWRWRTSTAMASPTSSPPTVTTTR